MTEHLDRPAPRSVHCLPFAGNDRVHAAAETCRCGPSPVGLDIATGAAVWIHRDPAPRLAPPPVPRRRSEVPVGRTYRTHAPEITRSRVLEAFAEMAGGPFSIRRSAVALGEPYWRTREAIIGIFGSLDAAAGYFENPDGAG